MKLLSGCCFIAVGLSGSLSAMDVLSYITPSDTLHKEQRMCAVALLEKKRLLLAQFRDIVQQAIARQKERSEKLQERYQMQEITASRKARTETEMNFIRAVILPGCEDVEALAQDYYNKGLRFNEGRLSKDEIALCPKAVIGPKYAWNLEQLKQERYVYLRVLQEATSEEDKKRLAWGYYWRVLKTEDEKTLLGSYSKNKEKYMQRFTSFMVMRSELLSDEVRREAAAKLWELVKEGKL